MPTTIYVRKGPYERDGKFGKQYLILGTDAIYYQQSKPFDKGVEEGARLEVELKDSQPKNPKYRNLKSAKLISHAPPSQVAKGQAGQREAPIPTPMLPLPDLAPRDQAEFIDKALQALKLAECDKDIDARLLCELVRQYHAEWMAERIDAGRKARIEQVSSLKAMGK